MADAITCCSQALGHDPESTEARATLGNIYWSAAQEAEQLRQEPLRIYYESLAEDCDPERFASILTADTRVSLSSDPPGAEVVAYRYVETDRVLRAAEPKALGRTPLVEVPLPAGSYLLVLKLEGFRDVRYPLRGLRGARHEGRVNLYTEVELGPDFLLVPGGPCTLGGDPEAVDPLPRQVVDVPDFSIARFPVTFADYLTWLNELERVDPEQAAFRAPRDRLEVGFFVERNEQGSWVMRKEGLGAGGGRVPVLATTWFDAGGVRKVAQPTHEPNAPTSHRSRVGEGGPRGG